MTTLTLKQAHRLTKEIGAIAGKLAHELNALQSLTVTIYDDVGIKESISKTSAKIMSTYDDIVAMTNLKYAIRVLIGIENEKSGLNALMASEAAIKETMKLMSYVDQFGTLEDSTLDAMVNRLDAYKMQRSEAASGHGNDYIRVDEILSAAQVALINKNKKAAKKRQEMIADDCAAINASTIITLRPEQVELLKKFDLI